MRPPRMTTRLWMAAVAVAALWMSGFVAIRAVWQHFVALDRVVHHAGLEQTSRWLEQLGRDELQTLAFVPYVAAEQPQATGNTGTNELLRPALDETRRNLDLWHRQVEYHAAMARKYRYVALFPWLPIEPDPPEPH